jgi:phage baseplate assembly protein W
VARETYLKFPFRLTPAGRLATSDEVTVVRDRIEQILFTSPGERVMLPQFGCGVIDLLFGPAGDVLAAAMEFRIAEALQSQLGNQAMINAVDVDVAEETVRIQVVYTRTRDLEQQTLLFERDLTDPRGLRA